MQSWGRGQGENSWYQEAPNRKVAELWCGSQKERNCGLLAVRLLGERN